MEAPIHPPTTMIRPLLRIGNASLHTPLSKVTCEVCGEEVVMRAKNRQFLSSHINGQGP